MRSQDADLGMFGGKSITERSGVFRGRIYGVFKKVGVIASV